MAGVAITRAEAQLLDRQDPLASLRERFVLPAGVVYLDGNSLGALPRGVPERVARAVENEWGRDLIRSWNSADWISLPRRVGARIARLVGAPEDSVIAGDSTSVQLFKLLIAAARLRPERRVLLTDPGNFPTDSYVAASVARLRGLELRWCDPADVEASLDDEVAVLSLTHVDYRTGRMHDAAAITAATHRVGALALWDLAHSAGAVPVALQEWDADLAVGCGYKYLCGGPGAPAFAYVHPRWQEALDQPLAGWMGHAAAFALERDYRPAGGIGRVATGTPPVLSMVALDAALDAFDGVSIDALRAKSVALTELFIQLADERLTAYGVSVASPREPAERGSQVSLRHEQAYSVVQALITRGVVGDYREPDLARFGFAPLYVRFVDVWDAVDQLASVLAAEEWRRPEHRVRASVT